jgi:hypothetical protein
MTSLMSTSMPTDLRRATQVAAAGVVHRTGRAAVAEGRTSVRGVEIGAMPTDMWWDTQAAEVHRAGKAAVAEGQTIAPGLGIGKTTVETATAARSANKGAIGDSTTATTGGEGGGGGGRLSASGGKGARALHPTYTARDAVSAYRLSACRVAWAVWSGRCWLRACARAAAALRC